MIVVDASVAVKWYVKEKAQPEALQVLAGEDRPIAPELIRVEVVAALCNQVRLYGKAEAAVRPLCERWERDLHARSVRLYPQDELMTAAWNIALRFSHAVQDCVYLALAEQEASPLITADDTFVKKVTNHFPRVRLLPGMADN